MTWVEPNNKLDEGQCVYRKGSSTCDNIFTLYAMGKKYLDRRSGGLYCVFVYFSRVFDSIPHSHLWNQMIHTGIHGKFLNVIRYMYAKLRPCVKAVSGISDLF